MFSEILNEIAQTKKRNSLNEFKNNEQSNTPKASNYVSDTNSKISSDNKYTNNVNKRQSRGAKKVSGGFNRYSKIKKPKAKANYIPNFNIANFDENIPLIINTFLEKHQNKKKVNGFRLEFLNFREPKNSEISSFYEDLYDLIREFPEFCIFDFFTTNYSLPLSEKQKQEAINYYSIRNNIFLRILIECKINDDEIYYLDRHIDMFVKLNLENVVQIDIDLDLFFLNLLGYKDKAKQFILKNLDYFKSFVKDYKELKDVLDIFSKIAFDKEFCLMNTDDLIIIRQIMNNMAKRKFFHGFQLLSINLTFACLMLEGRIWKSIILNFTNEQIYEIWKNYSESIRPLTCEFYVPTINEAYRMRLQKKETGQEDDIIKIHEKEELVKEINLPPVFDFRNLLKIMFAYKNKEAVLYFFEAHDREIAEKQNNYFKINQEVFEVCLQNDEDISILVAYKAINNDNAKESFMRTALLKKYFRLAVRLLKFKTCKNFLNSKPPEDDQSFLFMQQMQFKEKKDLYKNLELEKRLNQSKTNDDATADNPGKLDSSRAEENKKLKGKKKKSSLGKRNENNLIGIEDYEEGSNVNSSSLYSSKRTKRNRCNSLEECDLHRKINFASEDFKSYEFAELPRVNYTHRDRISNAFRQSYIQIEHQQLITESVNSEIEEETEILNNDNNSKNNINNKINLHKKLGSYSKNEIFKQQQEQQHFEYFEADKDSLFHPENTKNKKNLNEVAQRINSFGSSREIMRNPDLLILRENEARNQQQVEEEDIIDSYGAKRREDHTVLSEVGPSPKFEKRLSPVDGGNNFLNMIRTLKSNKNSNHEEKNEDYIKNMSSYINFNESRFLENNQLNRLQTQKSFKKPEEENKMNSDFTINVQSILIDNLRLGHYTFYCLSLLSSIQDRYLITDYSDKICKCFLVFTRDEDGISRCKYPILVCVLAAEFLHRLGRLNLIYQYKCHSVAGMMLQLGESLQSAVKDEEMLNYYLRDQTDFKNRSTLEIIAENRFYELLNDENVAAIVSKLWYGSGKNLNLWQFCRITRILSSNIKHEQYDDVINRTKSEMSMKNYSFQYQQYIKNCSVRYLVDSISTILTTILYQIIIYFYVSLSKEGDPYSDETFKKFNYIANCIVFTINLNLVLYLLYVYKTNRKLKFNIWIFLDCIMFAAVLSNFLNLSKSIAADDRDFMQLIDALIYSIIIICAWLRVISILMTTRTFGPFLRTIYLLLWTVFNFLLVFFAINTVFAQIFTIIFKKTNASFKTFFQSWITLFNASFGIYDFTQFTQIKVFGYSLLIAYTTLTNVMLLNLVIAIINNLFNFYEKKADAENRAVLVLTYERIKWDQEFGLLILLPAPFNLISIIFIIILLTVPDSKREYLNSAFSKITYFLIATANFFMLILWSILLFPLAYLKSLAHSAYDNHSKFELLKIHLVFAEIIKRPFVLMYYIIQDIHNFWKIIYLEESQGDVNRKNEEIFSKEIIYNLRKVLFDYKYRYKKKIISLDELHQRLGLGKKRLKESAITSKSSLNSSNNLPTENLYQSNTNADSNSSNDGSNANVPNEPATQNDSNNLMNSPNNNINASDENNKKYVQKDKRKEKPGVKDVYRYLVDKFVDKDKFVDIERTLVLLPARTKYSSHFLESLRYMNMRFILRGLRNFFFINTVNNPIYSYKKLQHMIYKILIKFKMIFYYIPETTLEKIKTEYREINKNEVFLKSFENLRKMEEADELSDYDDQGEFAVYDKNKNNNNNSSNTNVNSNANNSEYSGNNQNNKNINRQNNANTSSNSITNI